MPKNAFFLVYCSHFKLTLRNTEKILQLYSRKNLLLEFFKYVLRNFKKMSFVLSRIFEAFNVLSSRFEAGSEGRNHKAELIKKQEPEYSNHMAE